MSKQVEDLLPFKFDDLTPAELLEVIRKTRDSRSTPKKTSKRAKTERRQSGKKVDKTKALFDKLSDEEKAALLKSLEE